MPKFLFLPDPFPDGWQSQRRAMSVEEFLEWAGISRWKFYDEVRRRRLHPKKIGTRTVLFWEEIARWSHELPDLSAGSDDTTSEER